MRSLILALVLVSALAATISRPALAADPLEVGYSEETVILPSAQDQCTGTLHVNHDGSMENGYCWAYGGYVPPYYGAWAESFDLGPGLVICGAYIFTQVGYYYGQPMDAYVWGGGMSGPPSGVLCMVPVTEELDIPYWPDCGQNDIEIDCEVTGEFTVGFWVDFSEQICGWYACADENGPGGHPWACIAPGIGYPTGWQHPNLIFPDCVSMGMGAYFCDPPSPPESPTWGAIKNLFAR